MTTEMEAPPLERKLIAILAADVEGYSRLMGLDEEGTLATLTGHRAITDALIARHGGRICGTAGDSILAEFASIFAAVQCAVDIQRDLGRRNEALPEESRMWLRIGLNVGDVMVKDGDIFGAEHVGPISYLVQTSTTSASFAITERIARDSGSLGLSLYSVNPVIHGLAEDVAMRSGVMLSVNLTGGLLFDPLAGFSDFHGTGGNRAANSCQTDTHFVAARYTIGEVRVQR